MSDDRCRECDGVLPSVRDDWNHSCDPDVIRERCAAEIFGLIGMAVAIKKRQGYQEWMRITTSPAPPLRFVDVDLEEDERAF